MNLRAVDLNLLVALQALLTERSVTRAAKACGLTQPAMSNALARLRDVLGDPLLVRTPGGMQPTPRAESLQAPLASALGQIEAEVLKTKAFAPETCDLTFRVATQDYEQLVLLPALTARLAKIAPKVRLEFSTPRDRLPVDDLASGRIDLMIGVQTESHAGLFRAELLEDKFLCVMHEKHPEAKARLTLARFAALEHLLISPYGGMSGYVDEALAAYGLERSVKIAVPHFALAPFVLLDSPYVLTLPQRTAELFARHLPLKLVKPPLEIPGFTEHLHWHERTNKDPAHKWFRSLLLSLTD